MSRNRIPGYDITKANNIRMHVKDFTDEKKIDSLMVDEFFKKYKLMKHPKLYGDDVIKNCLDGIKQIIIDNEFKRVGQGVRKGEYLFMQLYLNDKKIVSGYFTSREILDISKLNDRITIKSMEESRKEDD